MGNFKQNYRSGGNRFGRRSSGGRDFGDRDFVKPQMFDAICAECGNSCQVPFRPSGDRPIYCSKCFESKRNGDNDSRGGSDRRNFERARFEEKRMQPVTTCDCGKVNAQNNEKLVEQLMNISGKLDVIISALNPKVVKPVTPKKKAAKK
ncbi:hypothetical protein HY030_01055 [Candidatus Gottesmanbacteria bacterium]|nr:hypothetical protein [Candidatus Gottesmanbacteria bacterium]